MTVTNVHKDPEALTMTITAEFDAPIGAYGRCGRTPACSSGGGARRPTRRRSSTTTCTPGGTVTYFMTGPEGDQPRGWWRVLDVDAPHRLDFEDGFADDDRSPNPAMPTMIMRVSLHERPGGGTRMAIETTFPSAEAMEQILAMGTEEGMVAAMSQIDGLLAEGRGGRTVHRLTRAVGATCGC